MLEEGDLTVHRGAQGVHDLFRNAGREHFFKDAAESVRAHDGRRVRAWEKGDDGLHRFREGGDGHIRAADEAVAGADDRTDGGTLTLRRQRQANECGERRAEVDEEKDVQTQQKDIAEREIPPGESEVDTAGDHGDPADGERGKHGGDVIPEQKFRFTDGRHRQIVDRARDAVVDHNEVGTERNGDTAHEQERGQKLRADGAVQHGFFDNEALGQRGRERVLVDLSEKHRVQ